MGWFGMNGSCGCCSQTGCPACVGWRVDISGVEIHPDSACNTGNTPSQADWWNSTHSITGSNLDTSICSGSVDTDGASLYGPRIFGGNGNCFQSTFNNNELKIIPYEDSGTYCFKAIMTQTSVSGLSSLGFDAVFTGCWTGVCPDPCDLVLGFSGEDPGVTGNNGLGIPAATFTGASVILSNLNCPTGSDEPIPPTGTGSITDCCAEYTMMQVDLSSLAFDTVSDDTLITCTSCDQSNTFVLDKSDSYLGCVTDIPSQVSGFVSKCLFYYSDDIGCGSGEPMSCSGYSFHVGCYLAYSDPSFGGNSDWRWFVQVSFDDQRNISLSDADDFKVFASEVVATGASGVVIPNCGKMVSGFPLTLNEVSSYQSNSPPMIPDTRTYASSTVNITYNNPCSFANNSNESVSIAFIG